jgi:threonine dehydrogenase-like Zn-dependent dehydrogenase
MQALVWRGPYLHETDSIDAPVPGPGEVLVRVAVVGICGSDLTAHKGLMGIAKPGSVRGHEFAGTIEAVGVSTGVPDAAAGPVADAALSAGTRVAVNPVLSCGHCRSCLGGRPSACEAIQIIGVHRPGAFAEFVIAPADHVHPIPDGMAWETAASCEPLAQARHDVARAAELGTLGECLVIGSGSIGLWIVHALRLEGADSITVVDPDASRRDAALEAGAAAFLPAVDDVPLAAFDTVFDVVGIAATRGPAIACARNGGTVVSVGLAADEVSIPWFDVVRREITVRGANTFAPEDFAVALAWLADGSAPPPPTSRLLPLATGGDTFAALVDHTDPFTGKTFFAP